MASTLDWTRHYGYELRLQRRTGGPITTKLIVAPPRRGPECDIEFRALWFDESAGEAADVWQVISVTDTDLQVTYLPTRLYDSLPMYSWGDYQVPDRADNFRFYECLVEHREHSGERRGYSFYVKPDVHPLDVAKVVRTHDLLKGAWKLVPGSIHEIFPEQHHYLTWQRRQQPNYYLWQERLVALTQAESVALTGKQQAQLMQLLVAGYVLHHTGQTWEVGQLVAAKGRKTRTFRSLVAGCARPADAIDQAAAQLLAKQNSSLHPLTSFA